MLALSCTFIGLCLFIFGSFGNGLCILVFLRKNFRYRIITPFFIVLLIADSIYLLFRLMKVPYYLNTLFDLPRNSTSNSCSQTFLVRIFAYATQYWHQALVPFIQPEIYLRFSLILMSIMSVQRTLFIKRSLKLQILPTTYTDKYKYKGTFLIIFLTFLLAYAFQFGGSTLFCSKSVSQDRSYDWFIYMNRRMNNVTHMLMNTIPKYSNDYQCVSYAVERLQKNQRLFTEANPICAKGDLTKILSFYFDQHDKSTVKLIQRIIFFKTGHNISRNDVYRKYHFHECLFPQEPNFFDRAFDFIYSRTFDFNRYTLILGKLRATLL